MKMKMEMNNKKIIPSSITKLKMLKKQLVEKFNNDIIDTDIKIKKEWERLTRLYVGIGYKYEMSPYRKGYYLITNKTDNMVYFKVISKIYNYSSRNTVRKLGYENFAKELFSLTPIFRNKVMRKDKINKILKRGDI